MQHEWFCGCEGVESVDGTWDSQLCQAAEAVHGTPLRSKEGIGVMRLRFVCTLPDSMARPGEYFETTIKFECSNVLHIPNLFFDLILSSFPVSLHRT